MKKKFEIYYEIPPMRAIWKKDVMADNKEQAKDVLQEKIQENIHVISVILSKK